MRCDYCLELIALSLEGALSDQETLSLEGHLSECSRCRTELLLQNRIREALQEEVPSGLSSDFTQRVLKRALEVPRPRRASLKWSYLVPAFSLTAATVALLVLGTHVLEPLSSVAAPVREGMSWLVAKTGGPLQEVISFVGSALSDVGARTAQLISQRASSMSKIPQPLASSLLITLLALVPAVLGLHRVFEFLRD
ncbi:MAG: hypothetical protein JSW03_08980 [Candidatus Eiseniibacteriota bacterium]|nr:MAG: hypothetical protein JSW03_08980 [Candidatus Eisenbacteria bacterium]